MPKTRPDRRLQRQAQQQTSAPDPAALNDAALAAAETAFADANLDLAGVNAGKAMVYDLVQQINNRLAAALVPQAEPEPEEAQP